LVGKKERTGEKETIRKHSRVTILIETSYQEEKGEEKKLQRLVQFTAY